MQASNINLIRERLISNPLNFCKASAKHLHTKQNWKFCGSYKTKGFIWRREPAGRFAPIVQQPFEKRLAKKTLSKF